MNRKDAKSAKKKEKKYLRDVFAIFAFFAVQKMLLPGMRSVEPLDLGRYLADTI